VPAPACYDVRLVTSRGNRLAWIALVAALPLAGACDRCAKPSPSPAPAASASVPSPPTSQDPLTAIRWDTSPIDWSRPVPVTPPGGLAEPGYVGSEACKDCHKGLYASYARHSMARTGPRLLSSLDARWLARIFDAGASQPVQHDKSGFWYRAFRKGTDYFIEEYVVAEDGSHLQTWMQPVTVAYSAGSYGMAFYFRQGSRLYQVPVDYYPKAARWGIDPGASEGNPRFSKPLRQFCISCHADYPKRQAGADDEFFDIATGVGCERCHGPGQKHATSLKPEDIVNPARLPAARQLDVCVQCHESNGSMLRGTRGEFSYRPGERLSDYRVNFVADPAESDRFILLAHPERMVQSRCWKASAGKMTCTSCHDPHKSSFDQPAAWWDAKCGGCHDGHACTETPQAQAAQGGHCVTCHMRSGPPTSPTLLSITDHWIQRRPPPIRPGSDKPKQVVAWPDLVGDPAPGPDLDAMRAVTSAHLGQQDEAERLAGSLVEQRAQVPQIYDWLAGRYSAANQPWNMARALAALLRFEPDSGDALIRYARVMLDRGPDGVPEAMHALDRMLAIEPDDPNALETKGIFLYRSGRPEEARPLFVRAAESSPAAGIAHVGLAMLARRDGREAEAVAQLEAAWRIEPWDSFILDRLRDAYAKADAGARSDDIERARRHFLPKGDRSLTEATNWLPEATR